MTFKFDGYNWVVRFERGEKVIAGLTQLVKDEGIPNAWVVGLGGTQRAELGFYNLTSKAYQWKTFEQLLEITSLQGNIAWEGDEPVLHLHGTFSDESFQAIGGHVKELEVGGTCEILLHRWYADKWQRKHDDATGLKLLDL